METRPPPFRSETFEETAAASDAVLMRVQKLLTASQVIVDASRVLIRDSRQLMADTNTLRIPAAHPLQSKQGFLPPEMSFAA
jgi:hypothetical protein